MAQLCPVCGSDNTGGSPKSLKNYTPDRGRLDVDFKRCHACMSFWDDYHYVREEVHEIKFVHLKDGRHWVDGVARGNPILCHCCGADTVLFEKDDGMWRTHHNIRQLRYECTTCGGQWQHMTRDDGEVMASRIWRRGARK